MSCHRRIVSLACGMLMLFGVSAGGEGSDGRPKRLLLIGQGPDGHPWSTHEYMSGAHLLARMLGKTEKLQIVLTQADEPWQQGPELLAAADGAVVFLSQGAQWLSADAARLEAFRQLAKRRGGLCTLHWGMGCKEAEPIDAFVQLFGGCHGGPDRKYKVVAVETKLSGGDHPVLRGVEPVRVEDEFYYTLKMPRNAQKLTPLLKVPIDGQDHTVAWAWERPDGGRSFGFSGLHFHRNWELPAYRRMVAQGVLWSLDLPIPADGLDVHVPADVLNVQRPKPE